MIFLLAILLLLLIIILFWNIVIYLTHFDKETAELYRKKELSLIGRLRVNIHLGMCFKCQNLIDDSSEERLLEDHLIDPED